MVIGAFVLARLLGLRLLTLEAQVVVHDGGRHPAGSGPLIRAQPPPGRPAPRDRAAPLDRPGLTNRAALHDRGGLRDRGGLHDRGGLRDRGGPRDRPVPPAGPGLAAGSDPLARAVQLVEQGADTLERTRRGQYRG